MTQDVPRNRFVVSLFLLVFCTGIVLMGKMVFAYITPIVLALVLLSLFMPVFKWLKEKTGGRENVAAWLTTTLVFFAVVVPLVAFIMTLSAQAISFYESTKTSNVTAQVTKLLSTDNPLYIQIKQLAAGYGIDLSPGRIVGFGAEAVKAAGLFLTERLGSLAGNAFGILLDFGMMLIFLAGLFPNTEPLKEYLLDLSPLPDEEEMELVDRFRDIAKSAFVGNGIASIIQGVIGGIGFELFGLGNGLLWGTAIGFFAFLPIVGASVVVGPATIVLFAQGHVTAGIGFMIYNAVYVAIFEYWFKTKMVGGQLNGTLVFFGIVAGLSLYGMLGLFYGPLIVTMFLTLAEIYKKNYRGLLMAPGMRIFGRDAAPGDTLVDDTLQTAADVSAAAANAALDDTTVDPPADVDAADSGPAQDDSADDDAPSDAKNEDDAKSDAG